MSFHAAAGPDGRGSSTLDAEVEFREVIAGEAITAGNLVTHYKSGSTMDGVYVYKTGTGGTDFVCGVATASVASGAALRIQTKGLGIMALATHSSGVAAAEGLIPGGTAGAADGTAAGSVTAVVFGYALAADTAGSVLAAGNYILDCWA